MDKSRVALALALLVACGHGNSQPRATKSPSSTLSSPSVADRLKVEPLASFASGDPLIFNVTGWDHYIAWVASDGRGSPPNRVVVYDLATRTKRIVARATTPVAVIDSVAGDRHTIVYSQEDHTPDDEAPNGLAVPWADYTVDLVTGKRQRILSERNARPRDAVLPSPRIEWPWVLDVKQGRVPGPGVDVDVYDLRTGRVKTVLSQVRGGSGFDLDQRLIVYSATSRAGDDLFAVGVDGSGGPRQLTDSGQVISNRTANGSTSWREPEMGLPQSLWWLPEREGAKPIRFSAGGYSPYPGRGFVAWSPVAGTELLAQDPTQNTSPIMLASDSFDTEAFYAAFGDRVVWATRSSGSPTVHIARIVIG